MSEKKSDKLSLWTVVLLIVVPTFGFGNITNNVVTLGASSMPSWFLVAVLFFLPMSLFFAELASVKDAGSAGIYTWIKVGLGEKWAFIGTWSYFISTLFYLQMTFARLPVTFSWFVFGENRFTDDTAKLIPYLSIVIGIALTWIATKGVSKFSKISDIGGKLTLAIVIVFIVMAFVGVAVGKPVQTEFTAETLIPKFDTAYFSTFSWLLLAVAGSEVGGTYVKNMENPKKNYPKAIFISTFLIGCAYVIGSLAVLFVASPESLTGAGVKDAAFYVYQCLGDQFGFDGRILSRIYAGIFFISQIASIVLWLESPIRALFSEVPEGTFPKVLTKQEEDGTLKNALWIQCGIVIVLIVVPLFGMAGIDAFFNEITGLSALSSVPTYALIAFAYLRYRLNKNKPETEFTAFKSNTAACAVAGVALILGILAYFGAGLDYFIWAETKAEAMVSMFKTYGGPVILVFAGLLIRSWSLKHYAKKAANK